MPRVLGGSQGVAVSYERGTPVTMPMHRRWRAHLETYRGTSLIRNTSILGPYSRTLPRVLLWSQGGELFLISEVLL